MADAFEMLRSKDPIWSRSVREYLMGERSIPIDIMAWNSDATRMPYHMHLQYLRSLLLKNDLAEGRFKVGTRSLVLTDIRYPIFVVANERDHRGTLGVCVKFCRCFCNVALLRAI
jgi:polyhydroxyalkanoate synthase subunit PhaC